jgi:hypothetical protein
VVDEAALVTDYTSGMETVRESAKGHPSEVLGAEDPLDQRAWKHVDLNCVLRPVTCESTHLLLGEIANIDFNIPGFRSENGGFFVDTGCGRNWLTTIRGTRRTRRQHEAGDAGVRNDVSVSAAGRWRFRLRR